MTWSTRFARTGGLLLAFTAGGQPAASLAQPPYTYSRGPAPHVTRVAATAPSLQELTGVVTDATGQPLEGVVVSALGATSVYAISNQEGRFLLRGLPTGPYVVRAHMQGFLPAKSRVVQVRAAHRAPLSLTLQKQGASDEPAGAVVALGAGDAPRAVPSDRWTDLEDDHDHAEVAWRLRHSRRSVLKDAVTAAAVPDDDAEAGILAGFGRAVGQARLATSILPDIDLRGQLNLLTTTSFDRPQDLFSADARVPSGVAFLSLVAPGDGGQWRMTGTATQGDLSSWIVSGSFVRRDDAQHAYEAGVTYAMQRYLGGNAEALSAMRDGSRNVGVVYGYDDWTVSPRLHVSYGARYADYGYLERQRLFSPRATVEVSPFSADGRFTVRASVSRSETAPGAVEFVTPVGGVWLPPERTFSSLSGRLVPQRVDQFEAGVAQVIGRTSFSVRAFRQQTSDQVLALFGGSRGLPVASTGHYHVGSVGDFDATGWGGTVQTSLGAHAEALLDYQEASADWRRLAALSSSTADVPQMALGRADRVRSVAASVRGALSPSDTRFLLVYRVNAADALAATTAAAGSRFEVQVNQALPFLAFTNAQWEALVALRNAFYDAAPGGVSVYDEILVVRPPTRVLGGITVKF